MVFGKIGTMRVYFVIVIATVVLSSSQLFYSESVRTVDLSVHVGILQPFPGDSWGDDRRVRLNLDIEIGSGLHADQIRASPFEFNVSIICSIA